MEDDNWELIHEVCERHGSSVGTAERERFDAYLGLLDRWRELAGLTALNEEKEIVVKHFVDSLELLQWIGAATIADVGSGAGFPGAPLAIVNSNMRVIFVEKESRKCRFLEMLTQKVQISASVKQSRADILSRSDETRYEIVVARALAAPLVALEICSVLVEPAGSVLLAVGPSAFTEVDSLSGGAKALGLELDHFCRYELPHSMGARGIAKFRKRIR